MAVVLEDKRNKEQWLCDDLDDVRDIDGVTYLEVYKADSNRRMMINIELLEEV